MHIAFNDMNPFPMKQLRQLRAAHRERLEAKEKEMGKYYFKACKINKKAV